MANNIVTGIAVPLQPLSLVLLSPDLMEMHPVVSPGGAFLCSAQDHEKVTVPAPSQSKGWVLRVAVA